MQSEHESITIKLDRSDEIIDLEDFGAMFAGLGEQFELFLKRNHPHISGHARVGIREMNKGSIIAEIAATIVPNVINAIQASIILGEFVDRLKTRYDLLGDGKFVEHASKKDISSIIKSIQAVSKDNEANASYTYFYRNEKLGIEEAKHFDVSTEKARLIEKTGNAQIFEMKTFKHADHREVLMVFTRADVGNAKIDHASGELVKIEEISRKSMPLIYQSALAEQRIKSEIRSGESVFQKGFVVDVNLRMRQEKPRAYAVVEIHDVIDLSRAG